MQHSASLDIPEIRALFFQPPHNYNGMCPPNAEDLSLAICEGVVLSCRFYLSAPDASNLIYFHGGSDSSDTFDAEADFYTQSGINVFLATLRGFGKSTGSPSLATLKEDAGMQFSTAIKWLAGKCYTGAILVMWRSLGSVCAVDVVHNNPDLVKAMILESAFCETIPLLKAMGAEKTATGFSENEDFNNLQKITQIKIPTMIFHGSRDTLVSISQAEKLQAASGAKNKQFLVIPGAEHNTVWKTGGNLYFQTIKGFIDTVCGTNTWRQRRRKFKADQDGGKS